MQKIVLASEFYYCQEPIVNAIGGVKGKHVLMIPTAALGQGKKIDPQKDTEPFTFSNRGANLTVFDLAGKTRDDLTKEVLKADIIYVRGGNTFYLLEHMRNIAFKEVLEEHFKDGVYIGSSAGTCVLSPDIGYITPVDNPENATIADYTGLGLVDFNIIPHANNEKYQDFIGNSYKQPTPPQTFVLTDNQALLLENNHIRLLQETT